MLHQLQRKSLMESVIAEKFDGLMPVANLINNLGL